ncbi:hypothetical protein EKD04_014955 [Chloroflexales bacterium ZM16-3]|nr:hypothetical protein [Chloroflexales bacterium ZM16-3]
MLQPHFSIYVRRSKSHPQRHNIILQFILLIVLLFALNSFLLSTPTVLAQQEPVSLEIKPEAIQLPIPVTTPILLVIHNRTPNPIQQISLSWYTEANINITVNEPVRLESLAGQGDHVWTIAVSEPRSGERRSGSIQWRVDYNTTETADGVTRSIPKIALATAAVTLAQPTTIEQIAQVEVQTSLTSISEQVGGYIFVVATNKLDVPITLDKLVVNRPRWIESEPSDAQGIVIEPRGVVTIPFYIRGAETVQPGKNKILFEAHFQWEQGGRQQIGAMVVSHEVEIGVLGESIIVDLLAIPSLLVLPGFLIMLTLKSLWQNGKTEEERKKFPKTTDAEFWLVALTLSGIMAFLYPHVTEYAGWGRRDYLTGYGITDIALVWIISIIFAILVYTIIFGSYSLGRRAWTLYQEWINHQRTPTETDRPIELLRKLHRQHLSYERELVQVKIDGQEQNALLLQAPGGDQVWIGPPIRLLWNDRAPSDLRKKVESHLGPQGNLEELARILSEGERAGQLRTSFQEDGKLDKPQKVSSADITRTNETRAVIYQE